FEEGAQLVLIAREGQIPDIEPGTHRILLEPGAWGRPPPLRLSRPRTSPPATNRGQTKNAARTPMRRSRISFPGRTRVKPQTAVTLRPASGGVKAPRFLPGTFFHATCFPQIPSAACWRSSQHRSRCRSVVRGFPTETRRVKRS